MMPTLEVTTPSDRELRWSRAFDAPCARLFEALTTPALVRRWLLGPPGWAMEFCAIDLRPGGAYRYVWRRERDGKEMAMGGVFEQVAAPERFVATETFEEAWYRGHALVTMQLDDHARRTTLTQTMAYDSADTRDGVLRSGWEDGVRASYDRLDAILAEASHGTDAR